MLISLDTETTGLDLYHSARPFFVTICDEDGEQRWWEWKVHPETRKVKVHDDDILDIREAVEQADRIVCQNAKFDAAMLREAGIVEDWPWEKTEDTLIAGHLLRSNQAHDLTTMALVYLGENIEPLETEMKKMVMKARNWARRHRPDWRIAKKGLPEMPSAKEKTWAYDMWLLQHYEDGKHADLLREYSNVDSAVTMKLWQAFEPMIKEQNLWEIYRECMKKPMCATDMERRGVTLSKVRLEKQVRTYKKESIKSAETCENIASSYGYDLQLPKSGNNGSLTKFCFDTMKLPVVAKSKKTGAPSFDKAVVDYYLSMLDVEGRQYQFVKALSDKRKRDTAIQYMAGYQKFWLPLENHNASNSSGLVRTRSQSTQEIPDESTEKQRLLDLDGSPISRQRIRPISRLGRVSSSSSKLPTTSRSDSEGNEGPSRVRRSEVRSPEVPVLGNKSGQYAGHDSQGERRQSARDEASRGDDNRRGRPRDSEDICRDKGQAGNPSEAMPSLRSKSTSHLRHSSRNILEASTSDYYVLHPSLNPTGTDTLRWSSSSPNEQNISKKEGFNLRYAFGPAPGREWWSLDYENIELRIPAYESGEEVMIELFERPDDPPYFGSYHLLNAGIVYPDLFWPIAEIKGEFKKRYNATWYQWCKNGGFAIQYGCQEAKADATFHKAGGYRAIKQKMPKVAKLSDYYIKQANRQGYIETLPDKSIGAERGYPIWCTRSSWGGVSPTVPFAYFVSGTAMWCTAKAMPRCKDYLDSISQETGRDYFIVMQVHDEIVFDFPAGGRKNLPKVRRLQRLMEKSGEDIGVPLKVAASYHPNNWSEAVSL